MKKLKPVDIFGYNTEEFDEWWRKSCEKMEKRTMRKFGSREDVQPLAAQRMGARKHGRRRSPIWKPGINSDCSSASGKFTV